MGGVPSTPRRATRLRTEAEDLLGVFVGEKAVPLSSNFWQELLELPLTVRWPQERVLEACQALAQNNYCTRHLAKVMIILVLCLQELTAVGAATPTLYIKAINGAHISSIFLKYLVENAKSNNFEELYLILEEEEMHKNFQNGQNVGAFIMKGLLSFISMPEISSDSCLIHHARDKFRFMSHPS